MWRVHSLLHDGVVFFVFIILSEVSVRKTSRYLFFAVVCVVAFGCAAWLLTAGRRHLERAYHIAAVRGGGQLGGDGQTTSLYAGRGRSPLPVPASAHIQCMAESDGGFVTYTERRSALRKASGELSSGDVAMITNFLQSSGTQTPGLSLSERLALKNDALDLLQRQAQPIPGLGTSMVKMLNDPRQPDGWRDYCLQGMAYQYARARDFADPATADAERGLALAAFDSAFRDADKTRLRGTALRGIDTLSRDFPEVERYAKLDEKIIAVIKAPGADEGSLITALRMYSARNLTGERQAIEGLCQKGSTTLLRKVALKTLNELDEREKMAAKP